MKYSYQHQGVVINLNHSSFDKLTKYFLFENCVMHQKLILFRDSRKNNLSPYSIQNLSRSFSQKKKKGEELCMHAYVVIFHARILSGETESFWKK